MFQYLLLLLLMFNSFLFMKMKHPLSMGLILMIQTMLIALFTGNFSMMFWFSYSLFLIFMGGMLILFMYMTSLASNETFKLSMKWKFINFISVTLTLSILMMFMYDFKSIMYFFNNIMNNENNSLMNMNYLMEQNKMLLNKMYNFPNNMITILLINYLFLTLIMTVKITNIFKGPIRQKK